MGNSYKMTVLAVLLALLVVVWVVLRPSQEGDSTLTLTFDAQSGGDTLVFDTFAYPNPGGEGEYRLRDFRFYLSNIELIGDGQQYAEPDSYHLVRFDTPDRTHSVTLTGVPLRSVEAIRFMIGVDADANGSIAFRGDLDPNSQMAWNWEVGYKFVVFEGALRRGAEVVPLVYHIGFTENARALEFPIPEGMAAAGSVDLRFVVDVARLFDGQTTVDLAALQSVKFDRDDARLLADNYSTMVEPAF